MNIRPADYVLLGTLLLLAGWPRPLLAAAPATETVMRLHWLGMDRINADTNAASFKSVWRLPQTTALVAQTFDKLSRWPGHGATNAASARLRPLLDDLLASEFYLEVSSGTNSQLLLAIRLPADRVGFWQTNLAAALEVRPDLRPVPSGNDWIVAPSHGSGRIEFATAGEWTLVGRGMDTDISPTECAARITRNDAPATTNFWFEADLNLPRFANFYARFAKEERWGQVEYTSTLNALLARLPFSDLHLAARGSGDDVLTCATLNLSRSLDLPLPDWDIPTNLIHEPLTSFTAVRGLAPWLAALPAWQKLASIPPPDQAFFWAQEGVPFLTYFAAPLTMASNHLARLAGSLVKNVNPWLATNGEGSFEWHTNPPSLVWNGALILSPFLKPIRANQHDYTIGGLTPQPVTNSNTPPSEILRQVCGGSARLVYYQTEQTGQRVEDGMFINQLFRLIFHKPQLRGDAAGASWLKHAGPLLDNSTTFMNQTDPHQFTFTRHSTLGFTALELHVLADWLESPQFPRGLHSQPVP